VLVWSAPWVGRADEGAETFGVLRAKARALRAGRVDVAIDLQGLIKSALAARASGATRVVGFASGYLREPLARLFEILPP